MVQSQSWLARYMKKQTGPAEDITHGGAVAHSLIQPGGRSLLGAEPMSKPRAGAIDPLKSQSWSFVNVSAGLLYRATLDTTVFREKLFLWRALVALLGVGFYHCFWCSVVCIVT